MANKTTKHSTKIPDPNARKLIGKKVYNIGNFKCPICGHTQKRGMVSEYKGVYYCNDYCVKRVM